MFTTRAPPETSPFDTLRVTLFEKRTGVSVSLSLSKADA
jgi:hypothetical protein